MSEHTIFDVSAELRSICGHDSFSVEDCFTCAAADLIESRSARIESQAAQIAALKTVMIAAAEEIASHWQAHCDAEGYGPQNLLRRLEEGIPSEYGYTAGAFAALTAERDAMHGLLREFAALKRYVPDPRSNNRRNVTTLNTPVDLLERLGDALAARASLNPTTTRSEP